MWPINAHTLAELRAVDVGSRFAARFAGEPLLPLKDCFALSKGKLNLYLDCKAANPEQLAREILEAGMERQVVVYLNLAESKQVQQVAAGKVATMTKWRPGFGDAEWAVTNGLAAVEIDAPDLTPAIGAAFHRAGIKVQAKVLGEWDRPEMWDRVMVAGADWLQTDLPEEVLAHALWKRVPEASRANLPAPRRKSIRTGKYGAGLRQGAPVGCGLCRVRRARDQGRRFFPAA